MLVHRNISWTLRMPSRELVELLARVEAGQRGARGGRDPEAVHDRLCAVVARPDRDPLVVEDRPHVVGVDAVEDEGEDARLLPRGADDPQARDLPEDPRPVEQQVVLVGRDRVEADSLHPVDRRAERDAAGDVRGARLELVGQLVPGGLLEGDGRDHVAPALPGRHGLEEGGSSVQSTHARRPVHLVPREGVEVAADRPHVHREVRAPPGPRRPSPPRPRRGRARSCGGPG